MKNVEEILETLTEFHGTSQYYRHPFGIVYTDGIHYLAENCGCYWLIDIVASYQFDRSVKIQEFQVFQLEVNHDKTAIIIIEDGNNNIIAKQELEFTDFPLQKIELWFSNGVLYLPTEH